MINLFGTCEFRTLNRFGKLIPGYYVPKEGTGIVGKGGSFLSVWINSKGYPTTTISVKSDFFPDYTYKTRKNSNCLTISLKIPIHRAVMETWKPIDENPPATLAEEWNQIITSEMVGQPRIPESYKQWVKDTALVDHIDGDPTNNHIDNLRWEIPKDNEPNRKRSKLSELLQD